jgi:hypothetical protein
VPGFGKEMLVVDGGLSEEARLGRLGAPDHGQGAFEELSSHWTVWGFLVSRFSQVTVPPVLMDTEAGYQPVESWA